MKLCHSRWWVIPLCGCVFYTSPLVWAEPEKAAMLKQEAKQSSWFEKDQDGVLWFRQGEDGQTKYSSALVLSAVTDGIVICVTSNRKHINGALNLAKEMKAVLEAKPNTPAHVPIVAWQDDLPGVGYVFYTDGTSVEHETLGKKAVYKPSEAKQMLDRVAKYYHILQTEYVAIGQWGKHHKEWEALDIVEAKTAKNSNNKK